MGAPAQLPEYHTEARVFVPRERFLNLFERANNSLHLSQSNLPFLKGLFSFFFHICYLVFLCKSLLTILFFYLTETEINDGRLAEARQNYAKRALKTLFNGSQKTFQVII